MINRILKTFGAILIACSAIVVCSAITGCAQEVAPAFDASKVPASAEKLSGFVPAGWKIEQQINGDVNDDGIADHLLKLKQIMPTEAEGNRALVIVFADKDGHLKKAATAGGILQCAECGGAFYGMSPAPANVSIEKGVIVVNQDHGSRWVSEMTFRFRYDEQPGMFILIGFDYSSRDRAQGSTFSESTNYLTGKRISTGAKSRKTTTNVAKDRSSIEEVDSDVFEEAAAKRLGVD